MKKLFLPLAIIAVTMSSCSNDEPNEGFTTSSSTDNGNLVSINAYAGTTRAKDTTTSTLEDSGYVELHIDDSDTIKSSYTFAFALDDWSQDETDKIIWDDITFPANFYSMHDGAPFTGLSFTEDTATFTDYTVSGASTEHKDLVYHASQLSAIPTGGAVSVYHKHALSKIHLYAATGSNNVYIARVNLVNIESEGTLTITPVTASEISTTNGAEWVIESGNLTDYLYFYTGEVAPSALNSTTNGSNPIINDTEEAPLMIIPQETTAATMSSTDGSLATFSGSYIEVIYYMTDSKNMPIVGYSSVAARADASSYIDDDQSKTLYVMGAFPLGYEFEVNKEYDISLGLGADNSSGGILIADYYVDKTGEAVTLTKNGVDTDGDGDSDEDDGSSVEIPEIDEGDDILADSSDCIDIIVTVNDWDDGGSITVEYTE